MAAYYRQATMFHNQVQRLQLTGVDPGSGFDVFYDNYGDPFREVLSFQLTTESQKTFQISLQPDELKLLRDKIDEFLISQGYAGKPLSP
jgi:hypothetical protein